MKNKKQLSDSDKLMVAISFYQSCPFTTKLYMALQTKLDMEFIINNWKLITK